MKTFFKTFRINQFLPLIAAPVVAGSVIMISEPAMAQIDTQAEIQKVEDVATMLSSVVVAFTGVLITPMGISAAAKVFKTLVLFNL